MERKQIYWEDVEVDQEIPTGYSLKIDMTRSNRWVFPDPPPHLPSISVYAPLLTSFYSSSIGCHLFRGSVAEQNILHNAHFFIPLVAEVSLCGDPECLRIDSDGLNMDISKSCFTS